MNDYWELALKYKAYGVHLGQEDLRSVPPHGIEMISNAGMRLGVSTHSFEEAAIAKSYSPSCVAIGPVFETTAKPMAFLPQGIQRVNFLTNMFECPVVAIGGMDCERGRLAFEAGADGVAVISDVLDNIDPCSRVIEWLAIADSGFG